MPQTNVVVVFYSRTGATEKLAAAAAVGAVNERALIRLRRMPDSAPEDVIAANPEWQKNHDRMKREYIAPREIDFEWADAIVLATPESFPPDCAEWQPCMDLLHRLAAGGKLAYKVALAFGKGSEAFAPGLIGAGMIAAPAIGSLDAENARQNGRLAARMARLSKEGGLRGEPEGQPG